MTTDRLDPAGSHDGDLAVRFTYHPPEPEQPEVYQAVRDCAHLLAILIEAATYPSRERSLAVTKIEEAVMWGNAGIARRGLTAAGIAGARDLVDHALSTLQQAKPDSEWIEDDGTHWSPVTAWERATKDAHAALTDRGGITQDGVYAAIAALDKVVQTEAPAVDDPWPPDGHVTPTREPLPPAYTVLTLRSALEVLTQSHSDDPGQCPACLAQMALNGMAVGQ